MKIFNWLLEKLSAKKHFELHLETLGVKEIITVANRK